MYRLLLLSLVALATACSHPLEIVGDGGHFGWRENVDITRRTALSDTWKRRLTLS